MVVRRVYLGVSGGCRRAFDRQDTRRGLHPELFEVGRHLRRQARALHQREPMDPVAHGLDLLQGKPQGLLLDSRVVDVPMSYNPIAVTLFSWKPFFFNGLQ